LRATVPYAALACLLATACARAPKTEVPPRISTEIGIHAVSFRVPEGWEHLNHGRQHRFQRDLSQISATDLGPVTPDGYMRELRRAHELFREHYLEDAFAHASGLDLRSEFADVSRRESFYESWWKALDGGRSTDSTRQGAEVAWQRVMAEVERLPARELTVIVEDRFPSIETAAHREIAEREPMEIEGRPALRVETRDRLSHDHRQSFLFVLNEGNLFVLRMELGPYANLKPAFETLAGSLAFQSDSTGS
jgi:hypothetical protein